VSWTLETEDRLLRLRWQEQGGPRVSEPQRHGFGLRLIEQGLAREVSGKVALDFHPEGLVCEWGMKLT
jgi:two-component sensor histidine kinase